MKGQAHRLAQWQPGRGGRRALLAGALALTLALGYLHYRTGLAYEFHVFFAIPVLLAAWFAGFAPAIGLALITVAIWLQTDHLLAGDQADAATLAFNTAVHLTMLVAGAGVFARLRRLLDDESRLAREDGLTGLANRREFHERGRQALALARRQGQAFTAAFIDLDRFKEVNDELGHEAGDALLVRVAGELRGHIRDSDIAGRLGGDEFALLLPGMDMAAAAPYVEALRQGLLGAMREQSWPVTFSIGVASCRSAPADLDALLAAADGLMYEAKNSGRDRVRLRELVSA